MSRWRIYFECDICGFKTSRPLGDFNGYVPETACVPLPCSNCSTELDAYDAGDGNEPSIVTDHRPLRAVPEDEPSEEAGKG